MFGLSWGEMLVVGIVALIVIGPKDLPALFRTLGQFTGKARMMAREFSRAMNDAANESGMKDMSNTIKAAANPAKFGAGKIKEATGMTSAPALSPERQAAKEKMSKAMGDAALERQAREAEEAAEAAKEAAAAARKAAEAAKAAKPEAKE